MKCTIRDCAGEYERKNIIHTVRHRGKVTVIDNVPAEVCNVCGDVLFTPATIRALEHLLARRKRAVRTAPVYEYKPIAA